jgi:hypothetical protein
MSPRWILTIHVTRARVPWLVVLLVVTVTAILVLPTVSNSIATSSPAATGRPMLEVAPASASSARPAPSITIPPGPQTTWINVTNSSPGNRPPPTWSGSAAYDPLENATVYFGGCGDLSCSFATNQTWVFANGTWANETNPFDAPPARDTASMDYDPYMQAILLFGGETPNGTYFNDTWTFRGGIWTDVTFFGSAPSPRAGAGLAFDPEPEENGSVLFGGYGDAGYSNDTWVWQSDAGWVELTPSAPPPAVYFPAMAFDPLGGDVVLFGGYAGFSGVTAATWELYSGQWWPVFPATSPDARYLGSMIYVPKLSGLLLFGGYSSSSELNDTWLFNNSAWTEQTPSTAPPARDSVGLALDGTGTTPIMVGGDNITQGFNDTWAYEYAPYTELSTNESLAEVSQTVSFSTTISGGTAPYRAEFEFGDGTTAFASGPGPTLYVNHVFGRTGDFTGSVTVTDAVGATCGAGGPSVNVTAGPAILAHASPGTGDVGTSFSFNTTVVSLGVPPITYFWDFGDGDFAAGSTQSHTFSGPGVYNVTVNATDSQGGFARAVVSVTVVANPSVTVAAYPGAPDPGAMTTFYANVTGGVGPYTYAWRFGDGDASSFADPQHAFATAGTYPVQVWVNDSVGSSVHGTMSLTVGSVSTTPSVFGVPWWFLAGVLGLVAVAVAGTVVLIRRGRT